MSGLAGSFLKGKDRHARAYAQLLCLSILDMRTRLKFRVIHNVAKPPSSSQCQISLLSLRSHCLI